MPSKITITLELGNDAFSTTFDVVQALRVVANNFAATGWKISPVIRDINGNRVGWVEIEDDDDDDTDD